MGGHIPTIVVAGVNSGVGKTTVTLAMIHALQKKGFRVQPFKVGPDYIDPSYHGLVAPRISRNLDVWMMRERGVINSFMEATQDADVAVIEGVMGLFDGLSGKNNFASTAHLARILHATVILVVDAGKAARSVAAVALGFLRFDNSINIGGLVLNNIASDRHATYILDALLNKVKIPVIGVIKRSERIGMKERHLGLIPPMELNSRRKRGILAAASRVSEQIDIDKIMELSLTGARAARIRWNSSYHDRFAKLNDSGKNVQIAIAMDESFNFYYSDNLQALRKQGAELVFFSPVHDEALPENISGIILGGGFPEILADKLEHNTRMIKSILKAVGNDIPIYAECAGLMYLTRTIRNYGERVRVRRMAGIIDADTVMTGNLTLNYTEAQCEGPIFCRLSNIRGHEFHYSTIEDISADCKFAYTMKRGRGVVDSKDGFIINENGLASYMHVHFADARLPTRFVAACTRYSRK